MKMGSMGVGKMWLLAAAIRGWRSTHELGFLPLYSLRISVTPSRVTVNRAYLGRLDSELVKFYFLNIPHKI
jgi:hypothetical protein